MILTGARPAATDGFVVVDGVRVHFEAWGGGGRPIVLVHGMGASTAVFRRLGPELAAAGLHVEALDLKGCGKSDRPGGDHSRPALAALVDGFLQARGIERVRALVGHSLGAAIALELAVTRAGRLDTLVAIDAAPIFDLPRTFAALPAMEPLGAVASRLAGAAPEASRRFLAKVYLRRIFGDPAVVTDELAASYGAHADEGYHRAFFSMLARLGDTRSLAAALPDLRTPTLVLWGGADRVSPVSAGEAITRALPHAELHVFPGCGHSPPEERPAETAAAILDFLARHPAGA